MDKTTELLQTVEEAIEELRNAAIIVTNATNRLTEVFNEKNEAEATGNPSVTLEAVRAVLAEKSRNGHTAEIRKLLRKYGAVRLSEIDPKHYEALLRDVEALKDAA